MTKIKSTMNNTVYPYIQKYKTQYDIIEDYIHLHGNDLIFTDMPSQDMVVEPAHLITIESSLTNTFSKPESFPPSSD